MSEPSNDELASALEKLADGDIAPSSEEPTAVASEPAPDSQDERPPLAATFPGAVPSASTHPDEIVADDPPVEESDDIVMTEPAPAEIGDSPVVRTSTVPTPRPPLYQTMEFRRTIIPILLTCSLLTLGFSSLKFAMGPNSIFSDLPMWLPITLMSAGVILLFLAVLNMLAVKHAR